MTEDADLVIAGRRFLSVKLVIERAECESKWR